jgi:hypothetical protein
MCKFVVQDRATGCPRRRCCRQCRRHPSEPLAVLDGTDSHRSCQMLPVCGFAATETGRLSLGGEAIGAHSDAAARDIGRIGETHVSLIVRSRPRDTASQQVRRWHQRWSLLTVAVRGTDGGVANHHGLREGDGGVVQAIPSGVPASAEKRRASRRRATRRLAHTWSLELWQRLAAMAVAAACDGRL